MTPQQIAFLGSILGFLGTFAVNQGWISKETYDWLVSPATLSTLGVIGTGVIAAYGLIISRKHGIITTTANMSQVDAVITAPKTAEVIPAKNVVGSVEEAENLMPPPRLRAPRHPAHPATPAANS